MTPRSNCPRTCRNGSEQKGVEALRSDPRAQGFVQLFDRFIATYGHFSDSGNDFSHVPWREDQAAVVRLIVAQVAPRSSAVRVTREDIAARPGGGRCLRAFDRAARFQVLREEVSSFFTLCHGYHRPLYLRLAELCGMAEWPPSGRAVFYLSDSEVRSLAAGQLDSDEAKRLVRERFEEEEQVRDAAVPDEIFGDSPGPLRTETGGTLSGVATSPGRHTGRAVKISSASQAPELAEGDVIVVPVLRRRVDAAVLACRCDRRRVRRVPVPHLDRGARVRDSGGRLGRRGDVRDSAGGPGRRRWLRGHRDGAGRRAGGVALR